MNLYEAMYARHSVRKYRKEAVEDSVIEGIFRFLDETEPLFPEIRIRIQVFPERGKKLDFRVFLMFLPRITWRFSRNRRKRAR